MNANWYQVLVLWCGGECLVRCDKKIVNDLVDSPLPVKYHYLSLFRVLVIKSNWFPM